MRLPRKLREGARYHVTARANRKEMILDDESTKELFLTVLKRAKAKFDFRIEDFCIMGNHFHLIIQPGKGMCLSSIMQWIMSVFAMAYNRLRHISGHVWGGRFFSKIIENLRELMRIFEYIDANPVKAQRVEDRREWRYGGLWHDRSGCHTLVEERSAWLRLLAPEHCQLALVP